MTTGASTARVDTERVVEESNKYLTFTLGQQSLGLAILPIREILGYREPTAVLRTPAHVRGVINLRGSVVPVLDLAVRFGRRPQPIGKKACILIIDSCFKGEKHPLGVIVDSVSEVITIATADIEPAPPFGGTIRSEFLRGLARIRGRFVALLAADSVFDMSQLATLVAKAGGASDEIPVP